MRISKKKEKKYLNVNFTISESSDSDVAQFSAEIGADFYKICSSIIQFIMVIPWARGRFEFPEKIATFSLKNIFTICS